jgi:UDP-2-acetamido-3-amino-2,3-dideoxy-glucuronate N-acetyltransferase
MNLEGQMHFYKHPQSIVESDKIGKDTRIWAFAHILPSAQIGSDCNICDHVFIENDVTIGDRVTIKSGVQLWDGIHIEDDVFVGPNVTFTNDIFPRSKQYPEKYLQTRIRKGASIGANATILPGITIEKNAMIGAGAVVIRNVPSDAIVVGNPAYITGYVSAIKSEQSFKLEVPAQPSGQVISSDVKGVKIYNLPLIIDMRGSLSFAEVGQYLPFIINRYFLVYNVASKEIRGSHAHKTLDEFLLCVHGSLSLVISDGQHRQEILLDRPNIGVHIPPMIWGTQYKYSHDAVLLALASDVYDADDYIRDYDEFLEAIKQV